MKDPRKRIVDFIRAYTKTNKYPPTFREIGHAVGLHSTSTIHHHLDRMRSDGIVYYETKKPRTIRVIK